MASEYADVNLREAEVPSQHEIQLPHKLAPSFGTSLAKDTKEHLYCSRYGS